MKRQLSRALQRSIICNNKALRMSVDYSDTSTTPLIVGIPITGAFPFVPSSSKQAHMKQPAESYSRGVPQAQNIVVYLMETPQATLLLSFILWRSQTQIA